MLGLLILFSVEEEIIDLFNNYIVNNCIIVILSIFYTKLSIKHDIKILDIMILDYFKFCSY